MLSHLRFHRRGAPTPSSPGPDHDVEHTTDHDRHDEHHHFYSLTTTLSNTVASAASRAPPLLNNFDTTIPSTGDGRGLSLRSSSLPPTLPPIARVASPDGDREPLLGRQSSDADSDLDDYQDTPTAPQAQQLLPSTSNKMESGFIGGVALENYRRGLESQAAQEAPLRGPDTTPTRRRPMPTPINTNVQARPPVYRAAQPAYAPKPAYAPNALHPNPNSTVTGLRDPSMRLPADYSVPPPAQATAEPPKTKKTLPFLKNPVSTLLMRRKTSQHTPDLLPVPLDSFADEPTYDPRIKGTRVHDFSAPRRKPGPSPSLNDLNKNSDPRFLGENPVTQGRVPAPPQQEAIRAESINGHTASPAGSQIRRPPRTSDGTMASPPRAVNSTSTTRSGRRSMASDISRIASIPRHMKSTSSRFSFDMIGAASAEKILEERHRQREAEKKMAEEEEEEAQPRDSRDSRFDDFDDGSFDYDAMMDDDGLEERIPGVNADYEEEEYYLEEDGGFEDPDNDQENFAGFAFQRSSDSSVIPTPQSMMATTPRDEHESRELAASRYSPQPLFSGDVNDHDFSSPGLGRQGTAAGEDSVEAGVSNAAPETSFEARRRAGEDLDLYYDDGMLGFEDEFAEDLASSIPDTDGVPFDESIFDMNDTDQYGRPIAGAFAKAQAEALAQSGAQTQAEEAEEAGQAGQAGQAEPQAQIQQQDVTITSGRRESDMSSRYSGQSGISRSTAHTSLSTDAARTRQIQREEVCDQVEPETAPNSFAAEPGSMEAYQAALAAAAHKAAASGKFQWSAGARDPEPNDGESEHDGSIVDESVYSNDDFGFSSYEDMDDFDIDDDAIIAEANASALANDSDGWYGQEFGFYSAPSSQHHSNHNSTSNGVEYEYANGGFFGPKGMGGVDRSGSGRVVSREPNLTPITERSEYSNRNSVMSMAMPHGFGTPVQSPGLAQLAMMSDRGDDMSLSALLRLRSRAWGGSQVSLASSKEGSPKSERGDLPFSPWANGHANTANGWHGRKGSTVSGMATESEAGSVSGSPTVTMSMPSLASTGEQAPGSLSISQSRLSAISEPDAQPVESTSLSSNHRISLSAVSGMGATDWIRGQEPSSPTIPNRNPRRKHRDSMDSISYVKEEESGETRWFLERRRTGDSGQEFLEREMIDGGRI